MKVVKKKQVLSLALSALFLASSLPLQAIAADTGRDTKEAARTVEGTAMITPECEVLVSSGASTAHYAVDGITRETYQWASDDMKTSGASPTDAQTPQWLTVDLGESVTQPVEVAGIQLWYNMKVWPMVYEIQTSSDNGTEDAWTTLVRVERSPFDGAVKNGSGQDIADETGNTTPASAANTDTITLDTTPALAEGASVERYVRFYVEKVNTAAPGNNVCLREIQVYAKEAEEPTEEPWNLALNRPVTASGAVEGTTASNAVDGSKTTQWNSPDLKDFKVTDNSKDQEPQTPQWLQIDLGATGSQLQSVNITYASNKVWAMEYELQTTDTPNDADSWQRVAYVSRASANSTLVNGEGQNIADPASYTDTITAASQPALGQTQLGRYVRLYIHKTNAQAPGGNNVNIAEIQLMGTNPDVHPPVDVDGELNKVTVSNPSLGDTQITLPTVSGADLVVRGSELENVVANDGAISSWNIGARNVTLLLRLTDRGDETSYAQKNVTVTVPDHSSNYPAEWFPAVTNPNPKPEVIPTVQEWYGYEGDFTLTADSKVILNDQANVGLDKVAQNLVADVEEISGITLTVETGTAPTSAHDIYIESLTDPNAYDAGDEGYLMVTTDMCVAKSKVWDNYGINLLTSDDMLNWKSTTFDFRKGAAIFSDKDSPDPYKDYSKINRVWAPQIFWDPAYVWPDGRKGGYLIYYSMLNRAEEGYDRMYYSYADESFTTLTKPRLLFDWGYATIDADINYLASDGLYHMMIKKEGGQRGLFTATAPKLTGPWSEPVEDDYVDFEGNKKCEGVSAFQLAGDSTWVIGYIEYSSKPKRYRLCRADKYLRNFHSPQDIKGVEAPQHGSFMRLTKEEYDRLEAWGKGN